MAKKVKKAMAGVVQPDANGNSFLRRKQLPHDLKGEPVFNNIQGYILKHHGRDHALHLFLQFGNNKAAVSQWLGTFAKSITSAAKQSAETSVFKQWQQNCQTGKVPPKPSSDVFCTIYLSKTGYDALGIDQALQPQEASFQQGMKHVSGLNDPAVTDWEAGLGNRIDAMVLLAHDDAAAIKAFYKTNIPAPWVVTVQHEQWGQPLKDEHGIGLEHFGYADGISQPEFFEGKKPGRAWDDNAELGLVLTQDTATNEPDCYGSYFVFRKLDQNVRAFKEHEEALGRTLFPAESQEPRREMAGGFVVGRFEDSTPILKHSSEKEITSEASIDNDFNYKEDTAAARCPFHAHIRAVNPRGDLPGVNFAKTLRIARRGITYDEVGRNGDLDWEPERGVGLLFMCFQSSLENGFDLLQIRWANQGLVGGKQVGTDPLIGQGSEAVAQQWPLDWGSACKVAGFPFQGFVTMLGGEYFFAPSIPFLAKLK